MCQWHQHIFYCLQIKISMVFTVDLLDFISSNIDSYLSYQMLESLLFSKSLLGFCKIVCTSMKSLGTLRLNQASGNDHLISKGELGLMRGLSLFFYFLKIYNSQFDEKSSGQADDKIIYSKPLFSSYRIVWNAVTALC